MTQDSLFDLAPVARNVERRARRTSPPSREQDADAELLEEFVRKLNATPDPVDRAAVAAEIRQFGETLFDASVRAANRGSLSWREIGRRIGVPFQTLHRRHGS
jgi:hypothetical protein